MTALVTTMRARERGWRTEFERVLVLRPAGAATVSPVCLTYWGATSAASTGVVAAQGAALYATSFGPGLA